LLGFADLVRLSEEIGSSIPIRKSRSSACALPSESGAAAPHYTNASVWLRLSFFAANGMRAQKRPGLVGRTFS
jgi:hypothetical protein